MSKISDELRKFIDDDGLFPNQIDELRCIADRIDAEMLELPRDRDGVPIHVGDTAWFVGRDDVELKVDHITFFKDKTRVVAMSDEHAVYSNPADFIHGRPDSWERIADELDEMVDASDSSDDRCEKLADFADRIRKLAETESTR